MVLIEHFQVVFPTKDSTAGGIGVVGNLIKINALTITVHLITGACTAVDGIMGHTIVTKRMAKQ